MYDIIVIGAGPAGLTAAIYARRAKKEVLVLEALTYGGQIINTLDIENYPGEEHISGFDFATKLYNQTKNLGATIKFEKVIDIEDHGNYKSVITKKEEYKSKTIIIATGTDNRKLKLENEDKFLGRGISYCATCDGNFYKDKIVAVAGGGKIALEDSLYLSDIAKKVYLINNLENFSDEELLEKIKVKDNCVILTNSKITKLIGEDKFEKIEINNNNQIEVEGLFVAIGKVPENENFRKLIELNEAGYAVSNEDCHTKTPGIYVAGDNRVKKLRQLVTATSDGAIAATEAIRFINKK